MYYWSDVFGTFVLQLLTDSDSPGFSSENDSEGVRYNINSPLHVIVQVISCVIYYYIMYKKKFTWLLSFPG